MKKIFLLLMVALTLTSCSATTKVECEANHKCEANHHNKDIQYKGSARIWTIVFCIGWTMLYIPIIIDSGKTEKAKLNNTTSTNTTSTDNEKGGHEPPRVKYGMETGLSKAIREYNYNTNYVFRNHYRPFNWTSSNTEYGWTSQLNEKFEK